MILEELTLEHWRGFRDVHVFRFEPGLNLVVGPNEAGKSTLFEALSRVLFDRHNSQAKELQAIRPLDSALAPEVRLVFRSGDHRHSVWKRFLDKPACEMRTHRGEGWELDCDGDAADQRLRELLKGPKVAGAGRAENRGLAQALWYLQRDDPLPREAWSAAVKEGVAGVIQLAAVTPDEAKIVARIEQEYAAHFTAKRGEPKKGSELYSLQMELIPQCRRRLSELEERARVTEQWRGELAEKETVRERLEAELEQARRDVAKHEELVKGVAQEEQKRHSLEGALERAERHLEQLTKDHDEVQRRLAQLEAQRSELLRLRPLMAECESRGMAFTAVEERHRKAWQQELEPKQRQTDEELGLLSALINVRGLESQAGQCRQLLDRLQAARQEYDRAKARLSELAAPSAEQWRDFQQAALELKVVSARIEAAAIRIQFDLQDKTATIEATPPATSDDQGEYLVAQPTAFTIAGVGTVRVRGGGQSLEELNADRERLRTRIAADLERFGADSTETLEGLYSQRITLESEVRHLQSRCDELARGRGDLHEELAAIQRRIEEESSKAAKCPAEWNPWDEVRLRQTVLSMNEHKRTLADEIRQHRDGEQTAAASARQAADEARRIKEQILAIEARLGTLEKENAAIIGRYGATEQLAAQIAAARQEFDRIKTEHARFMDGYAQRVEAPKRMHAEAVQRWERLRVEHGRLREEMAALQGRIEEAAARGEYSQRADLATELEMHKRRLESVTRRAKAAALLRSMVAAFRDARSASLPEPVAAIVNVWLGDLTGQGYRGVELSNELLPLQLRTSRYQATLPVEWLSFGTHEQLIVLLRLALGVALSKTERQLVVIDDRLVNADATRCERMCRILSAAAADHCQIILATCREEAYASARAHIVRLA